VFNFLDISIFSKFFWVAVVLAFCPSQMAIDKITPYLSNHIKNQWLKIALNICVRLITILLVIGLLKWALPA